MSPTITEVRVVMAHPRRLPRRSLANLLVRSKHIRVVGEASAASEALAKVSELRPDVVVLESSLPDLNSKLVTEMASWTKVVVLADPESPDHCVEFLKAGARGYVGKDIEPEALLHFVFCVAYGGVVATPGAMFRAIGTSGGELDSVQSPKCQRDRLSSLTPRETEVLALVARGATNREIARLLLISESTVKAHLRRIMDKLHLNNKAQAAALAAESGILRLHVGAPSVAQAKASGEKAVVAQGA